MSLKRRSVVLMQAIIVLAWAVLSFGSVSAQGLEVDVGGLTNEVMQWQNPNAMSFSVTVTATGQVSHRVWFITTNSWLSVSPSNVISAGGSICTAFVNLVSANLDTGNYHSVITIVSPLATNTTVNVPVVLAVTNNDSVVRGLRVRPHVEGVIFSGITIPIELVSTGDVNAVGFSLEYDKNKFTKPSVSLGSGASPDGTLLTNFSLATRNGRIGVGVSLPVNPAQTFAAGVVTVAVVNLSIQQRRVSPGVEPIRFADSPMIRQFSSALAEPLIGSWPDANVMLISGNEGNLYPNTTNSEIFVTVDDVSLIGLYAVGAASPATADVYQRADCAPLSFGGDAALTLIDWIQTARFAAALDPVCKARGPTAAMSGTVRTSASFSGASAGADAGILDAAQTSRLSADSLILDRGAACTVKVNIEAQGTENCVGFSLRYDPEILAFRTARRSAAISSGQFLVNDRRAAEGILGFVLALSPREALPEGAYPLVEIDFVCPDSSDEGKTPIAFTDDIVIKGMASTRAKSLGVEYANGTVIALPENWNPAPPVPALSSQSGNPVPVGTVVPVEVAFDKMVYDFEPTGIVVANAALDNFQGRGKAYSFNLTPLRRGRFSAGVPAGVAFDVLGTPNQAEASIVRRVGNPAADLSGDGVSDMLVYDYNTGRWYARSLGGALLFWGEEWGGPGMLPVPGDYDGDGKSDLAVYHAATGLWFVRTLAGTVLLWAEPWGGYGMAPVAGDYNADFRSDLAVYHVGSGQWFIRGVDGQVMLWGQEWGGSGMGPVSGDYDGDGASDMTVYCEQAGAWFSMGLAGSVILWAETWGGPGMAAVAGDYDGDGISDLAVYDRASGAWFVKTASGNVLAWAETWGGAGMAPLSADWDGDGVSDMAVYDLNSGAWYVRSMDGRILMWAEPWGGAGMLPVAE